MRWTLCTMAVSSAKLIAEFMSQFGKLTGSEGFEGLETLQENSEINIQNGAAQEAIEQSIAEADQVPWPQEITST